MPSYHYAVEIVDLFPVAFKPRSADPRATTHRRVFRLDAVSLAGFKVNALIVFSPVAGAFFHAIASHVGRRFESDRAKGSVTEPPDFREARRGIETIVVVNGMKNLVREFDVE